MLLLVPYGIQFLVNLVFLVLFVLHTIVVYSVLPLVVSLMMYSVVVVVVAVFADYSRMGCCYFDFAFLEREMMMKKTVNYY